MMNFNTLNLHYHLASEETKRLNKLEAIADKLKRGENVQSIDVVAHYLHTNYCQVVND